MNSAQMIKDLTSAFGPPGFEEDVNLVAQKYVPAGYRTERDKMNNFYMFPEKANTSAPVVLLDAHSDELGLMVHYIKPNGTIAFTGLGNWTASVMPSSKVAIRNRDGRLIAGIVASKPPHFSNPAERDAPLAISNMVIDIGASAKEEVEERFKIGIGAPIVPHVEFDHNAEEDIMIAKAFDCRLGCAAVLDTLVAIKGEKLPLNVVGAFSTQEENGIRGAKVVGRKVAPDLAIVFEGSPADDTFVEPSAVQTAMRKGPMLRHMDAGMVTHPRFIRFALDVARKYNIPVQESVRLGGSTNGAAYHLLGEGVPTIVIGYPVRYIHSNHSIATMADYQAGVDLAKAILKELNAEVIEKF
ncbi:MAG: M20/M25/M40 family metallo-hydrolase [Defluviitaleaceae bacterium]|nr:M20/M25/M40 family metallo-hydrolase [Defluviitaleaceae bacterium]